MEVKAPLVWMLTLMAPVHYDGKPGAEQIADLVCMFTVLLRMPLVFLSIISF